MSKLFTTLSILMGVVVLSSNYLVQFPINYYGLSEILTFGAFSYPVAFLITDLANRFYGKFKARKIVYIGFFIGIIFLPLFLSEFSFFKITNRKLFIKYWIKNWKCLLKSSCCINQDKQRFVPII